MAVGTVDRPTDLWKRYVMALEEVTERLRRICRALEEASVPYALVGGQAVAMWVATIDPAAVRTTKDVDILLRREDLPAGLWGLLVWCRRSRLRSGRCRVRNR